ncbi:Ultraviolet-B receptor uvr8 [Salvia divinorum]|uniref:Ultraviolet-B receptor uvr8 n=1 Tax=Salvia divinorum TaxID=28513 RepID=A0ABD1G7I1_SALDI
MADEGKIQSSNSSASEAVTGPIRRVLVISAGASHSVALLSGNVVCSWGRGEDGQLGHGDAEDRFSPTQLSVLDDQEIDSVTCGADHTTAYSKSQVQVYSWGWGDFGRLGHGNSSDLFSPQPIKALQGLQIKQIACGDSHCLAVTMEGEVQSWGRNQNGQLGLGTTEDSLVPRKIEAFEGILVKMVAAGAEHTAAVTEGGEIYGWGWGRYGNLGLGDRDDRLLPAKVATVEGEKMVLVACGWRHTISISSSGSLFTYGWSKYGQLGHGDFEDHLIPHKLEALRDHHISQISGGWRHTMAATTDGKLYGWGWNKFGQVGVGNNTDHCSPVQVKFPLSQKVVNISCGWRHTLAVTDRQNVFSWGRGTNGQLGHGDAVDRNVPKIIEALSMDGSSGQHIEASKVDVSSEKSWVSPTQRYAVVPNENAQEPSIGMLGGNRNDANVPESDVKRMRI